MTINRKSGGFVFDFFYQIHAGNPGTYIYGRVATGNLFCSGITSVCKAKPAKMAFMLRDLNHSFYIRCLQGRRN